MSTFPIRLALALSLVSMPLSVTVAQQAESRTSESGARSSSLDIVNVLDSTEENETSLTNKFKSAKQTEYFWTADCACASGTQAQVWMTNVPWFEHLIPIGTKVPVLVSGCNVGLARPNDQGHCFRRPDGGFVNNGQGFYLTLAGKVVHSGGVYPYKYTAWGALSNE